MEHSKLLEPIKIKVSYAELMMMRNYLVYTKWRVTCAQAHEELIVLSEQVPIIERQLRAASGRRDYGKPYPYSLPLSVARILHRRWQQEVISDGLRLVLGGLDYELTNRNMKPDLSKPMIV